MKTHRNSLPDKLAALHVGDSHFIECSTITPLEAQQRVQSILSKWSKHPDLRERSFVKTSVIVVEPNDLTTYRLVKVTRVSDKGEAS